MGHQDGRARLWDGRTGQLRATLTHGKPLMAVGISRDGTTLITAGKDNTARAWEAATGKLRGRPYRTLVWPYSVALSPDGRTALAGTWTEFTVHVWDSLSGRRLKRFPVRGAVHALAVSPDNRRFAFSTWGELAVRLGDFRALRLSGLALEHPAAVRHLAFSPDSRMLLTGCSDGNARLYHAATGQRLGPLFGCPGMVRAVGFSSDGTAILAASRGGLVRRWELPAPLGKESAHLARRVELWTELLTGMRLDGEGYAEWHRDPETARRRLAELGGPPARLAPTAEQVQTWHRQEAKANLAARQWLAALWHAERLLAAAPDDAAARRDRFHALLGMGANPE